MQPEYVCTGMCVSLYVCDGGLILSSRCLGCWEDAPDLNEIRAIPVVQSLLGVSDYRSGSKLSLGSIQVWKYCRLGEAWLIAPDLSRIGSSQVSCRFLGCPCNAPDLTYLLQPAQRGCL